MTKILQEFNLLDEPWIKVIKADCTQDTVSLMDVLLCSQEYEDLSGDTSTQDIAVFRLLLAVIHAVFYKVDENGMPHSLVGAEEVFRCWKRLWDMGQFPEKAVREYLEKYRERFWLFHPEKPFFQVPEAQIGTAASTAKLNGEISESSNKVRLFSTKLGNAKFSMDYPTAARWLLHLNGFDDTSAKPKGKNLPSVGAGWLGKLGLIRAKGNNLFESLMLNLVLLNHDLEPWESANPIWEYDKVRSEERVEIVMAHDQAALLTLQSRRILLARENGMVTGYSLLGGDFFKKENAFSEQMTLWRPIKEKEKIVGFQPKRHDPTRKMWRDFSTITVEKDDSHIPGVVDWIINLKKHRCLEKKAHIKYQIISTQFGDKDFFVTDIFDDALELHLSLFTEVGERWRRAIISEIDICEKLAECVGYLEKDLLLASGDTDRNPYHAKEQFYYSIDIPFRNWLFSLDPDQKGKDINDLRLMWRDIEKRIVLSLGREMVDNAGPDAYKGRKVKIKQGKIEIEKYYSAPASYNSFYNNVKRIME